MKKQDLAIKVKDHRGSGDVPEVTVHRFDDHKAYLQKMKEVTRRPQAHVTERTRTIIHVQPETQKPLFADE
jgi:hypothetical protein